MKAPIQMQPNPARSGFAKGCALVGALWLAFALGASHERAGQAEAAPDAAPAAAVAPKAHKPAAKRKAQARPIRVSCGAYDVTFKPHDFPSREDAIEAASAMAFNNEGCAFK